MQPQPGPAAGIAPRWVGPLVFWGNFARFSFFFKATHARAWSGAEAGRIPQGSG
jgi:hypothetical protein